jgi:hypothetical protein
MLRSAVNKAIARVAPAHLRGREVAATLATLRRVNAEVEQRQEAQAAGVEQFSATGRIAPPPYRDLGATAAPPPPGPQLPEPSKVSAALDALLGRGQPTPKPEPAQSSKTESAGPSSPSETTTTLLAAKRRARQRLGDSPGAPPENQ